jgi:hypothetical protein
MPSVTGTGTEQAEAVNMAANLDDIALGARRADPTLELGAPADPTMKLPSNALCRALANLVDNARR